MRCYLSRHRCLLKDNTGMKATALRDIVFAHAIETTAASEAVPSPQKRDAITQETLHALGGGADGKQDRASFEKFLQARAQRLIAVTQLPAEVRQVWLHATGKTRWLVIAVLLGALLIGFVGHSVLDPHRVDLLSPALIGIVLWNVLMYLLLLANWLRGLFKRKPKSMPLLQPTDKGSDEDAVAASIAEPAASGSWWQKLRAPRKWQLARGNSLRKMALNFERNWWQSSQGIRRAQWLMVLHLGAALFALGALASLWMTGLTREYQVGWESTFLLADDVLGLLNTLFLPVQQLFGQPAWNLDEIQALQGWRMADASTGSRWVVAYSQLLALAVIMPRVLLALWQGLRAAWLQRHMSLPLQQAYFQKLQRDWAGRATALQVLPYSLEITPERLALLQQHVRHVYGAGAQLTVLPVLAYGAELSDKQVTKGGDISAAMQNVLLLNMAATPEAEIHGELLSQLRNRWGAQAEVWLWAFDFRERNSGAPGRVKERQYLWQEFVRSAGLNASVVPEVKAEQ